MSKHGYESSAKIFIICVIAVMIILFILVIDNAKAQQRIGYLVVTETIKPPKFEKFEVLKISKVDSILSEHMGHKIQASELLKDSPYYTAGKLNRYFYIEIKKVIEKKNGKLKFKKIKKKGVHYRRSTDISRLRD